MGFLRPKEQKWYVKSIGEVGRERQFEGHMLESCQVKAEWMDIVSINEVEKPTLDKGVEAVSNELVGRCDKESGKILNLSEVRCDGRQNEKSRVLCRE